MPKRQPTEARDLGVKKALYTLFAICALSLLSATDFGANVESGRKTETIPTYGYVVVATWPHDRSAFTQGLAFDRGILYEGTGGYGASSLRTVDLATGKVQRRVDLPANYFGEGIAILHDKIFQLTWRGQKGFIYDRQTFNRLGEFSYSGQGWGLTTDGESLIMSDGSDTLRYLDPQTFAVRRRIKVHAGTEPVDELNELEFVKSEILANVWHREMIARIDPETGRVRGWIDLTGLHQIESADAVLNGIAYDEKHDRLVVTGKLWPTLFQIRIREPSRK